MTGGAVPHPLLDQQLISRYLDLLGVARRKPGLEALTELVTEQLARVPFENVSKLYNKKHRRLEGLPPIETYLEGIERFAFGGTCYSNNFHFYSLLASLGYEIKLCSADMRTPDVHMVSMVTVDEGEYLVDVGYAAPFSAPLPRQLKEDHVVALGNDRYVLKPQDAEGCSRLEMYREGTYKHGYTAKPAPRGLDDFRDVIAASFAADATFMNSLLLAHFYPDSGVVLHNLTATESTGLHSTTRDLVDRSQLISEVEKLFGIPGSIVADVVQDLERLQDPWT